jgi:rubrerythrin
MAPLAKLLGRFDRRQETVRECRRCGTTVELDEEACPTCDSTEIASYRLQA